MQHKKYFSHVQHQPSGTNSATPILLLSYLLRPSPRFPLAPYISHMCPLSSLELQPSPNSILQVCLSPQHPIYKTTQPSILEIHSRIPTPVLPKPLIPCPHSKYSRDGCESRFCITSRRFDTRHLQKYFWPPCP